MISSVFTLKEAEFIPDNLANINETKLQENYYTNNSLDFLLECHNELLLVRQDFYKTVLESDNQYIINESFNDILNKIKAIIKKILAYIETLVRRFITQLGKFIQADKYILLMKNDIKKFPKQESFNISGYNFTIEDNIPAIDIEGLDLSKIKSEIQSIDKDDDITNKISKLAILLTEFSNESKMNDIRGQILNVDYSISETDFANTLFAIYRDNKSEESTIKIKYADVMETLQDYEGYKDKIKKIKSLENNIKSKYKILENQINSIISSNMKLDGSSKINNKIDSEKFTTDQATRLKNTLDNLVLSQTNQIQRIANLHLRAIAGKMDAYNALTMQSRNILYRALNIVQKNPDNTFVKGVQESLDLSIDETTSYDYTRDNINIEYLLEKKFMNLRQKRFVEECLVLSESNIPELKKILEDLQLDEKNMFDKLKDLLEQIFKKFSDKIKQLITNDKKFLESNKDIILNKKIPEYTLNNMPAYSLGIKNIEDGNLPVTANLDKLLPLTETEIQKLILPKYDGNGDFADFAKRFFLCNNEENKDRKSTDQEVDMKNIYEFCINNTRLNSISNGVKSYSSEVSKIKSEIAKTPKHESFNDFGFNYIYSTILELYINEEDATDTKKEPETTIQKNPDKSSSTDQNAKTNLNLDNAEKDPEKNKDDEANTEDKTKTNAKLKETANWYLKNLRVALTAKMTAYQKIYSEYMSIIRHHVDIANGKSNDNQKDQSEVFKAMKEYLNAEDKKSAADKVISAMKAYDGRTIDAHDVEILVNKNKSQLEKG